MKGKFMKVTVLLCLIFTVIITFKSLCVCEALSISPEKIYIPAMGFFGGELIMMLCKKIINEKEKNGKNANSQNAFKQ